MYSATIYSVGRDMLGAHLVLYITTEWSSPLALDPSSPLILFLGSDDILSPPVRVASWQ